MKKIFSSMSVGINAFLCIAVFLMLSVYLFGQKVSPIKPSQPKNLNTYVFNKEVSSGFLADIYTVAYILHFPWKNVMRRFIRSRTIQ